jgi:hypothetical protein
VRHSLSADLLATVAERFGVMHCIGNSLVHAAGRDAMVQALTVLWQMARSGGHVVVDSATGRSCTLGAASCRLRTGW